MSESKKTEPKVGINNPDSPPQANGDHVPNDPAGFGAESTRTMKIASALRLILVGEFSLLTLVVCYATFAWSTVKDVHFFQAFSTGFTLPLIGIKTEPLLFAVVTGLVLFIIVLVLQLTHTILSFLSGKIRLQDNQVTGKEWLAIRIIILISPVIILTIMHERLAWIDNFGRINNGIASILMAIIGIWLFFTLVRVISLHHGRGSLKSWGFLIKVAGLIILTLALFIFQMDLHWRAKSFRQRDMIDLRGVEITLLPPNPDGEIIGADLEGVTFADADLTGANLNYAKLNGTRFHSGSLNDAILTGAQGQYVHFLSTDMINVVAYDVIFKEARMSSVNLTGAELVRADLLKTTLAFSCLNEANLDSASLIGTNLSQANLQGALLHGTSLIGAKLISSNLHEAEFENTRFQFADMRDIRNFNWDNINECNLHGVLLLRDQLPEFITVPDGTELVYLKEADNGYNAIAVTFEEWKEIRIEGLQSFLNTLEFEDTITTSIWELINKPPDWYTSVE